MLASISHRPNFERRKAQNSKTGTKKSTPRSDQVPDFTVKSATSPNDRPDLRADQAAEVLTHSQEASAEEEMLSQGDIDESMRQQGLLTQVQFSISKRPPRRGAQKPSSDLEDDAAIEEGRNRKGVSSNKISRPPDTAPSSEMLRIQHSKKNDPEQQEQN